MNMQEVATARYLYGTRVLLAFKKKREHERARWLFLNRRNVHTHMCLGCEREREGERKKEEKRETKKLTSLQKMAKRRAFRSLCPALFYCHCFVRKRASACCGFCEWKRDLWSANCGARVRAFRSAFYARTCISFSLPLPSHSITKPSILIKLWNFSRKKEKEKIVWTLTGN